MAEEENIPENAEQSSDNSEETTENNAPVVSSKKKIILILIPIIILLLGVAGLYFSGLLDGITGKKQETTEEVVTEEEISDEATEEKTEEGEVATSPETEAKEVYFDLPDILVNLNSKGNKQVYLKVLITLAIPDAETSTKVENYMPRILDSFQVYLRELTVNEIQASSGMYRLKEELVERINRVIAPSRINDVLFREMLIQ